MRSDQIIIEPVLTEKSNGMRDSEQKKYTFKVDSRANKTEIKYAVEKLFQLIEKPGDGARSLLLRPELIVGGSTGKCPPGKNQG